MMLDPPHTSAPMLMRGNALVLKTPVENAPRTSIEKHLSWSSDIPIYHLKKMTCIVGYRTLIREYCGHAMRNSQTSKIAYNHYQFFDNMALNYKYPCKPICHQDQVNTLRHSTGDHFLYLGKSHQSSCTSLQDTQCTCHRPSRCTRQDTHRSP